MAVTLPAGNRHVAVSGDSREAKTLDWPDEFKQFRDAPLTKIAMNFRVVERDAAHCTVITETRVYAGGAPVVRRFAAYWRVFIRAAH